MFYFYLLFFYSGFTQTHIARNISMTSNSDGYYEYLPQGYNLGSQNYPLIIFAHGSGELGGPLSVVLGYGIPKLISLGQFPTSFSINNQAFSFIVISPHFKNWPVSTDIENIINYLIQNYRIDQSRIYLTGLSMGGGITWDFAGSSSTNANHLAAIVPIAGASKPDQQRSRIIANANLPVWATHNNGDPEVPVSYTNDYISNINSAPAPNPPAKKTIFNSNTHDAWTQTYDPNWRDGVPSGPNIYEWMLQYQQRSNSPLPVALINYSVGIVIPNEVTISWITAQEQNNSYFTIERSVDGINFSFLGHINATNLPTGSNYIFKDKNPATGNNYYRLSQTDISGKITYFQIKKVSFNVLSQNEMQIYPNPVRDNLTMEMNNTVIGKIKIKIIDGTGKIAKIINFNKVSNYLQASLPVIDLKAGYYLIKIESSNYSSSLSFVKK